MVRGERLPIRCVGMSQQMLPGSPLPFLSLHEKACLVVIHPIPHDVVGRRGELMAYCFDGNDLVRLCTLSFIVPLYHFVMPSGDMRNIFGFFLNPFVRPRPFLLHFPFSAFYPATFHLPVPS